MSLISLGFLLFVVLCLGVYFVVPARFRWVVLLLASYTFYTFAGFASRAALPAVPVYELDSEGTQVLVDTITQPVWKAFSPFVYLVVTTVTIFLAGLRLGKNHTAQAETLATLTKEERRERKKSIVARFRRGRLGVMLAVLLLNLGILGLFKYYNFFALNLNILFGRDETNPVGLLNFDQLILPLGLSFYTFQSLSYLIDVYRGKYVPEHNLGKLALFVSFFPQMIQGPISRYDQLAPGLYAPHTFDYTRVKQGAQLILWGFFKKLVLADRIWPLVVATLPAIDNPAHKFDFTGGQIGFVIIVYMIQMYADFSGGIDITRGVAQCFGIDMVQNFQRPHFATSIGDYWRRWHISLGAWMRDYVMYPLSLSKAFAGLGKFTRKHFGAHLGKMFPACVATVITFLCVGVWHGASWPFVFFGLYYGTLIALENLLNDPLAKLTRGKVRLNQPVTRVLASVWTVFLVFIGKYFSIAGQLGLTLRQAFSMIKRTFLHPDFAAGILTPEFFAATQTATGLDAPYNVRDLWIVLGATVIFFAVSLIQEFGMARDPAFRLRNQIARMPLVLRWALYYAALLAVIYLGVSGTNDLKGFAYAQF